MPPLFLRALPFLFVLSTMACGPRPVPLTAELRRQHGLGTDELRRLQLYVSRDVTLRRVEARRDRAIDDGALRLRFGRTVEEIVIRRRTPCVAKDVDAESITVAFEDGSTLRFELPAPTREPLESRWPLRLDSSFAEPPAAARPEELPPRSDATYGLAVREGSVLHRGLVWEPVGESLAAELLVDAEELDVTDEHRRVVGGRRL